MRQLRVENTLYDLPDQVWRQVNDLLSKAEGRKRLTQEMLKDDIPVDEPKEDESPGLAEAATSLGEDLADEEQP